MFHMRSINIRLLYGKFGPTLSTFMMFCFKYFHAKRNTLQQDAVCILVLSRLVFLVSKKYTLNDLNRLDVEITIINVGKRNVCLMSGS